MTAAACLAGTLAAAAPAAAGLMVCLLVMLINKAVLAPAASKLLELVGLHVSVTAPAAAARLAGPCLVHTALLALPGGMATQCLTYDTLLKLRCNHYSL
jgi:hypothetical protein